MRYLGWRALGSLGDDATVTTATEFAYAPVVSIPKSLDEFKSLCSDYKDYVNKLVTRLNNAPNTTMAEYEKVIATIVEYFNAISSYVISNITTKYNDLQSMQSLSDAVYGKVKDDGTTQVGIYDCDTNTDNMDWKERLDLLNNTIPAVMSEVTGEYDRKWGTREDVVKIFTAFAIVVPSLMLGTYLLFGRKK
jgi:hypothetical protein